MKRDIDPVVYSTDGSHRKTCSGCGQQSCVCPVEADIIPSETTLSLRLEKKGRGGKTVTVVGNLPPNESYFAGLTRKLKSHCGAGGALKEGGMEIQGDHREKVGAYLEQMGFKVRRG